MVDYDVDIDNTIPYDIHEVKQADWKTSGGYAMKAFAYRPRAVNRVLEGDQRYVTYMFTWAQTPKEICYWSPCQDASWKDHEGVLHPSGNRPLSEEQRSFLRWLVRPEVEDKGE
jgi:hypothetical protein